MATLTTLALITALGSTTAMAAPNDSDFDAFTAGDVTGFEAEPGKEFRHTPVRSSSSRSSSSARRPVHSASRSSHSAHRSSSSTARRTVHSSSRRTVVHTSTRRPNAIPATSRPPSYQTRVVHHSPTVRVVRPYHGVFVYGPRPVYHRHYHVTQVEQSAAPEVQQEHLPTRRLDRTDTLAVGLRTGSYYSAYDGANGYADVGLGLTARYRPAEQVGLELALSRHADDWDSSAEVHTVTQGSVMLFASPWSRILPASPASRTPPATLTTRSWTARMTTSRRSVPVSPSMAFTVA